MAIKIEIQAIRSRPRFKIKAAMSTDQFCDRLKTHFQNHQKNLTGFINSEISVIKLRKDSDKFWAPQLQIRVEKDEDEPDKIVIRGLFGPKSAIWTLFMFCYGLGGAIILTTGIYGWIELALGIGSFWVWTNLLGFLLLIVPYLLAQFGQRISKNHMRVLRTFMETVVTEEKLV